MVGPQLGSNFFIGIFREKYLKIDFVQIMIIGGTMGPQLGSSFYIKNIEKNI